MCRMIFGSLGFLALVVASSAWAADSSNSSQTKTSREKNNQFQATVSKVDSQNDKLTVEITGKDGNQSQKTIDLDKNVEVRNAEGKAAKLSDLQSGEVVSITEDNGKARKIEQENVATITKVDAKDGTVTVEMPDKSGKEVSRTFHSIENAEFIDSSGNVAALDVFRAGDRVLLIEEEGKIKSISKTANEKSSNVTQRNDQTSGRK